MRILPIAVVLAISTFNMSGCCLHQQTKADPNPKMIPADDVIREVAKAALDPQTICELDKAQLQFEKIEIQLEVEDDVTADGSLKMVATLDGSYATTKTHTLTVDMGLPDSSSLRIASEQIATLAARVGAPSIDATALKNAINRLATTAALTNKLEVQLGLTQSDFVYDFDFSLKRSVKAGVDATIGKLGVTATVENVKRLENTIKITLKRNKSSSPAC